MIMYGFCPQKKCIFSSQVLEWMIILILWQPCLKYSASCPMFIAEILGHSYVFLGENPEITVVIGLPSLVKSSSPITFQVSLEQYSAKGLTRVEACGPVGLISINIEGYWDNDIIYNNLVYMTQDAQAPPLVIYFYLLRVYTMLHACWHVSLNSFHTCALRMAQD